LVRQENRFSKSVKNSCCKCGKKFTIIGVDTARICQERHDDMKEKENPALPSQGGVFRKNVFSITGKPFSGPLKKLSEYWWGNFRHFCQVLDLHRAWVIYYYDFPRGNPSPSTIFLTPLAIFRMKPGDRQ